MRSRVLSSRLRERFVVTTKTGVSFVGVLYSFDSTALVLKDALAVGAGEDKSDVPLDGEQLVPWDNVDFMQRP